jgi:hypothetical protein
MARQSKVDQQKAKEAKQKKILLALLPLLLILGFIQAPKLMHRSSGNLAAAPPPTAPTAPVDATATAAAPSVASAPSVAAATPAPISATAPSTSASGLADTDVQPVAGAGQLVAFDLFASKDPFIQQVSAVSSDGVAPVAAKGRTAPATRGSGPFAGGGSPVPDAAAAPSEPTTAVAGIRIDGRLEQVRKGHAFPQAAPVFQLVSFDRSVAKIAIVGGAYQDGSPTMALPHGKTVTLQNTADGTRYVLVYRGLVKVPTASLPADAPPPEPTTTTTSTPTTTTTAATPAAAPATTTTTPTAG